MLKKNLLFKILLIACLISFFGCSGGGTFALHEGELGERTLQPAQTLLVDEQREKKGFGLYSYLLFRDPPTEKNVNIYLSIISACVDEIPDVESLESKGFSREELNVVHIPVNTTLPLFVKNVSVKTQRARWSKWILQNYNYQRARSILNRFGRTSTDGPYILSTLKPAQNPGAYQTLYLLQDFSVIPHSTPKLAFQWVIDFIGRVSIPQRWNDTNLIRVSSRFRDSMERAFKSHHIQLNESALDQFIRISEPDIDLTSFPKGIEKST